MTDIDDEAERLVDAALNGDARAIKQVAEALDDASDEDSTGEEDEFVKPVKQPGYGITLHLREGESHEQAASRAALDPATQSAAVACNVLYRGNVFRDEVNINSLAEELRRQVKAVNEGNLDRGEAMLAAQAHTLDALYNLTIRRAFQQEHAPHMAMFFKVALRAQSQCRATWEAISRIQNPPIAGYLNQTNIANNQQVNNGAVPLACSEKSDSAKQTFGADNA